MSENDIWLQIREKDLDGDKQKLLRQSQCAHAHAHSSKDYKGDRWKIPTLQHIVRVWEAQSLRTIMGEHNCIEPVDRRRGPLPMTLPCDYYRGSSQSTAGF